MIVMNMEGWDFFNSFHIIEGKEEIWGKIA